MEKYQVWRWGILTTTLVLCSYISLYISAHPDRNWVQTQSMQSSPKLKISFWPLIAVAFLSYSQSNATANIVWTLNFSKRNVWNCRNLRYWFSSNFTSKADCFIINFRSLGGFDIDIDTRDKIYWKSHHRHFMSGFLTNHLFFYFLWFIWANHRKGHRNFFVGEAIVTFNVLKGFGERNVNVATPHLFEHISKSFVVLLCHMIAPNTPVPEKMGDEKKWLNNAPQLPTKMVISENIFIAERFQPEENAARIW